MLNTHQMDVTFVTPSVMIQITYLGLDQEAGIFDQGMMELLSIAWSCYAAGIP